MLTRRALPSFAWIALAAVLMLAGGCSDSPAPVATPTTTTTAAVPTETLPAETLPPALPTVPEACDLLTQAEAEQLVGTALDPPNQVEATCTFTGPVTGPTAQVEIFVGDGAEKFLEIDRDTLGHVFTTVEGVADEAHAEENAIFFKKGGTWVAIRLVLLNDPAENAAGLVAIATTVASRL